MEAALTDLTRDIEQVVSSVFGNMLGLSTNSGGCEDERRPLRELSSLVTFTGAWQGMVSIGCNLLQARRFAERFLSLSPGAVDDRIALDVLGELTNMVAGNLKPLFASDLRVSMATVSCTAGEPAPAFTPAVRKRIAFYSAEGTFAISVLAAPARPGG